jgi:dTDP-4-amino-4,6-dideoxygalactose transaminase
MVINWVAKKNICFNETNTSLQKCIDSKIFTNNGDNVTELELFIKHKFKINDSKSVICVCNGTCGLYAIVGALSLFYEKEHQWVTQSFTFPSSAQGMLKNTYIVDIDQNGGLDIDLIPHDVDGIIVTNVFGNVVDIDKYLSWCTLNNKFLVFDNAATAYSFYKGQNSCNYGVASMISLHHTKPFGFGEGGAVIIDKKYEQCVRRIINFGIDNIDKLPWNKLGGNYKMSEINAIFILQYLNQNFDKIIKHHIELYKQAKTMNYKMYPNFSDENKCVVACLCFIHEKFTQNYVDNLINKKIHCRKYYNPLIDTPNANKIYHNILCYPCNLDITSILL